MNNKDNFYRRTWAEIDLDALSGNIRVISELSRGKEIIAVIKANAYGHGAVPCARALNEMGITHFAVSNLREAQILTEGYVKGDIIIFGYCDVPAVLDNLGKGYIFTVGSEQYAKELSDAALERGVRVTADIKLDTGMSRVGISTEREADYILSQKGLDCRGAYTHFAVADSLEPQNMEFTRQQQRALEALCKSRGLKMHSQNSGGITCHSDFDGDFVRAGIMLYGHRGDLACPIPEGVKPLFSLKTIVSQLKRIPAGATVSYGRTFTAERETLLAMIPCGYADGFNRHLSGNWSCLVRGKPAPICGRICMDQAVLDVTDILDISVGDIVTVYSDKPEDVCSLEKAAAQSGTISHEILCCISARVPRVYIKGGKTVDIVFYG